MIHNFGLNFKLVESVYSSLIFRTTKIRNESPLQEAIVKRKNLLLASCAIISLISFTFQATEERREVKREKQTGEKKKKKSDKNSRNYFTMKY